MCTRSGKVEMILGNSERAHRRDTSVRSATHRKPPEQKSLSSRLQLISLTPLAMLLGHSVSGFINPKREPLNEFPEPMTVLLAYRSDAKSCTIRPVRF